MEVLTNGRGLYRLPHPYRTILRVATSSMQMVFFHIFTHDRYFGIYMTFFLGKQYTSFCSRFTLASSSEVLSKLPARTTAQTANSSHWSLATLTLRPCAHCVRHMAVDPLVPPASSMPHRC